MNSERLLQYANEQAGGEDELTPFYSSHDNDLDTDEEEAGEATVTGEPHVAMVA